MATVTEKESIPAMLMDEDQFRRFVCDQFKDGSCRMDEMQGQIQENTVITNQVKTNTARIVEVFQAMEGGFKVLGWIGSLAKWGTIVGGSFMFFYKLFTGKWPV